MASILEKIEAHLQTHSIQAWEGTFRDYLPLVLQQPALGQRAHTRLYTMIQASGVRVDEAIVAVTQVRDVDAAATRSAGRISPIRYD